MLGFVEYAEWFPIEARVEEIRSKKMSVPLTSLLAVRKLDIWKARCYQSLSLGLFVF